MHPFVCLSKELSANVEQIRQYRCDCSLSILFYQDEVTLKAENLHKSSLVTVTVQTTILGPQMAVDVLNPVVLYDEGTFFMI